MVGLSFRHNTLIGTITVDSFRAYLYLFQDYLSYGGPSFGFPIGYGGKYISKIPYYVTVLVNPGNGLESSVHAT